MLPKRTKKAPTLASSDKVVAARVELKTAAQKHQSKSTRSTKRNVDAAKAAFDDAYTEVLEEQVKSKTSELDSLHHEKKHAAAWAILRDVIGKKATPATRIKGGTKEQRLDSCFHHFSSPVGKAEDSSINLDDPFFNNRIADFLPIKTGPFTFEELGVCLKKLKNSKTPDPNNIHAVIWKSPLFHEQLLEFCNETYQGNKPAALSKSSIKPLPKKGDLQIPQNYRGITLSALASKIYNSMPFN